MTRLPWLTLAVVAAGLVFSFVPGLAEALELRRQALSDGAWWRLITGQLVHWTPRMALFDLGAVLVLGAGIEIGARRTFVAVTGLSLVLVGFGIVLVGGVDVYRGASGLASALFVAAALLLMRPGTRPGSRWLALVFLLLFTAKIAYEAFTGQALAAGTFPAGVRVTPAAHLLGAMTGAAGVLVTRRWKPAPIPPLNRTPK